MTDISIVQFLELIFFSIVTDYTCLSAEQCILCAELYPFHANLQDRVKLCVHIPGSVSNLGTISRFKNNTLY